MQTATIMRFEALRKIETGDPFDLVFITADRKRGTGGEIKEVKGFCKVMGPRAETRAVGEFRKVGASASMCRQPDHDEHKTINIFNPESPADHAIKVHWRLMIFFNHVRIIG